MPTFSQKHRAFSLIELLTVIAIIGIISAVAFVSLNSNKSASRLKTAQREVTSTIKLAQTYALQGKTQGGVTPCGYGFRFKDTSNIINYEVFYNPPGPEPQDCAWKNDRWQDRKWQNVGQTPPAETFALKNGVTLSSPAISSLNNNDTEIYFTVPHAEMFNKDGIQYPSAQVLEFNYGGAGGTTKTITINPGGYITEN